MTWAYVQGAGGTGSVATAPIATMGASTPVGNLVMVGISGFGVAISTVTDNLGNIYTRVIKNGTGGIESEIWYSIISNTGTLTVTCTGADYSAMVIDEFSGVSIAPDANGSSAGIGTIATSGNVAVAGNDLVYAVAAVGNTEGTHTPSSGYTGTFSAASSSGVYVGIAAEYLLNSSTNPADPGFTFGFTPNVGWTMCGATFISGAPLVPKIALVPYISKNGLFVIGVTNPTGTSVSEITAITGHPSLFVNASPATLYGPVWHNTQQDLPFVTWQITSTAPLSTDAVTYTIPQGCITTALGSNNSVLAPVAVTNYVGKLEPGFGGVSAFGSTRTMPLGANLEGGAFLAYAPWRNSKNLRYATAWQAAAGGTIVFDSTDPSLPSTFTGKIFANIGNYFQSNGIEVSSGQVGYPTQQGQWSIQFKDINALNGNKLNVWLVGDANVCNMATVDTAASGLVNGTRTVAGDGVTVTVVYSGVAYKSTPNLTHGYNMALQVYANGTAGNWGHLGTITQFWMFAPGDSVDMNISNPYAMPNWLKSALTASNGAGPSIIRALNNIASDGYANFQDYADCIQPGNFSYNGYPAIPITLAFARAYNTGAGAQSWSSTKLYNRWLGQDGSDAVGPYLDLSARGGAGESDFGAALNLSGNTGAAIEFVSAAPHGLRTGDIVLFPTVGAGWTDPNLLPITGGGGAALVPHVTLTHGGFTATFASSVTVSPLNNCFTFSGDSSGAAYSLVAGTGTSFAMSPSYQGSNTSTAIATPTAVADISNFNPIVYVTSATTFACACGFTFNITGSGAAVQTITSAVQIPITIAVTPQQKGATAPYGWYPGLASTWAGCKCLLPLMPYMSVACLQAIADEIAGACRVGQEILFELGDEHWNLSGFPVGFATTVQGKLTKYAAPFWTVNHYYTVPATPVALGNDVVYTLLLGYMVNQIIQPQFDTHGKQLKASVALGGQIANSQFMSNMIAFASSASIPTSYGMVAPYMGSTAAANNLPEDTTWAAACSSSGGNWPCKLILDFTRHSWKYSSTFWGWYSSNYAAIQTYAGPTTHGQTAGKPTMIGYEGGVQDIDPNNGISLEHDLWYHPAFGDTWNAAIGAIQDGNPTVPGSGLATLNLYELGSQWGNAFNPTRLWSIYVYQGQLPGDGSTNVGTTDQFSGVSSSGNGLCNDMTFTTNVVTGNVSIAGAQMLAWFAATNTPPPPTTSQYFEQALEAKLLSISELNSLVGSSIYTQALPQTHDLGADGPALCYSIPTKPRGHVLTGSDGTATARVQIDAWSYSYATSKQIVEAAWNAIDGPPGIWGDGSCIIMSVVQQDDIDASERPQAGSDQWTYHLITEYNVKYRVAIPTLT